MKNRIDQFISDLELIDPEKASIIKELYRLFINHNSIKEKFIYGGIGMYIDGFLIGGIYASKHHVSLIFSRGNEMTDTYRVFEGEGKYRRYIKLKTFKDIKDRKCNSYIEQAIELKHER